MNGKTLRVVAAPEPAEPEHLDLPIDMSGSSETYESWAAKVRVVEREIAQARAQEAQEARLAATRRYRR